MDNKGRLEQEKARKEYFERYLKLAFEGASEDLKEYMSNDLNRQFQCVSYRAGFVDGADYAYKRAMAIVAEHTEDLTTKFTEIR